MTQIFNAACMTTQDIAHVAHALDEGAVVIFPTDTVYGIGCSSSCQQAVKKIYRLKERPAGQPLQILISGFEEAQKIAVFSKGAAALAQKFWPGALTLVVPPSQKGLALARGAKGLGLRVPACATLLKILQNMKSPLCSTSANLHGQPVLTKEEGLETLWGTEIDIIIKGGTLSPVASSVVDMTQDNTPRLLREGSISRKELSAVFSCPLPEDKV